MLVTDTYDSLNRINSYRRNHNRPCVHVEGKNSPTTFLPLNTKIGGQARYIKDKEAICLTKDQARHIYKKLESENIVNVDKIEHEIEADKLDNDNDNLEEEGEINPYNQIITNKVEKNNMILSQIEQWSILSNIVNYVQYDRHPKISMI